MKDKLAKAREKGRSGWETCPPDDLSRMLREHVEKGDPRDVANFAMMLWSLGAGIAATQPAVQPAPVCIGWDDKTDTPVMGYTTKPAAPAPEGMVLVPRDLVGAACAAIEGKRDAPKTLEQLRRYTTGDLSTPLAAPAQPAPVQETVAWADAEAISNLPAVDEAIRALLDDKTADNATAVVQAILGATQPAQPAPVPKKPALPYGWNNLTEYILQDDLHNRLTPRVVDIAYSAFMSGRTGKNKDDGGPCDWFNDTKPMVMEALAKIRKDLAENSRDNTKGGTA
jgi:hypothetical protein